MDKQTIFVTGIDTDAGKSYATGWLANLLRKEGRRVRTQKFVQTGNVGRSEDIEIHRAIMGEDIAGEDYSKSAPVIFAYPASADLAARLEGKTVDLSLIDKAREANLEECDTLLIEGAGGLMVPLSPDYLTVDYLTEHHLDVALVTNGKLGSINHTLLALEAIARRGLNLSYLLYNEHFDKDKVIADDAREYIRRVVNRMYPGARFEVVPTIEL